MTGRAMKSYAETSMLPPTDPPLGLFLLSVAVVLLVCAVLALVSLLISVATLRALSTPRVIPAMAESRLAPGVNDMLHPYSIQCCLCTSGANPGKFSHRNSNIHMHNPKIPKWAICPGQSSAGYPALSQTHRA